MSDLETAALSKGDQSIVVVAGGRNALEPECVFGSYRVTFATFRNALASTPTNDGDVILDPVTGAYEVDLSAGGTDRVMSWALRRAWASMGPPPRLVRLIREKYTLLGQVGLVEPAASAISRVRFDFGAPNGGPRLNRHQRRCADRLAATD